MDYISNHLGDIICIAYYPVLFLSWKHIEEFGLNVLCVALTLGVNKD